MPRIDVNGRSSGTGEPNNLDKMWRDLLAHPTKAKEDLFLRRYGTSIPHSELFKTGQRLIEDEIRKAIKRPSSSSSGAAAANLAGMMGTFRRVGGQVGNELYNALGIIQRRGGVLPMGGPAGRGRGPGGRFLPDAGPRQQDRDTDHVIKDLDSIAADLRFVRSAARASMSGGIGPGRGGTRLLGGTGGGGGGGYGLPMGLGGGGGFGGGGGGRPSIGMGVPPFYGAGRSLGTPSMLGKIAAGVAFATDLPMLGSQLYDFASKTSAARPFMDLKLGAYNLTRAAGGGSAAAGGMTSMLAGPGGGLASLGVDPATRLRLLQAYGVTPGTAGNALGIVSGISRASRQSVAFAGMGEDTVARLAGQGVGLGMAPNTGAGVQQFLTQFSGVMATAVAAGVNRAPVLQSMQGSMSSLAAAGGASINAGAISDIYGRTIGSGSAMGRSGAAAASLISGATSFSNQAGRSPLASTAFYMAARANGGLGSSAAIQKFTGMSDDQMKVPANALAVQDIMTLWNNPNTRMLALQPLAALTAGNPSIGLGVAMKGGSLLSGGATGNLGAAIGRVSASNLLGQPNMSAMYAYASGKATAPGAATGVMATDVLGANYQQLDKAMQGSMGTFDLLTKSVSEAIGSFNELANLTAQGIERLTGLPVIGSNGLPVGGSTITPMGMSNMMSRLPGLAP